HPPRTAGAQHIENSVEDLAQRPSSPSAARPWLRQMRCDQRPFRIGYIASIAQRGAIMLCTGGRVPHSASRAGFDTPLESQQARAPNPYCTAVSRQALRSGLNQVHQMIVAASMTAA